MRAFLALFIARNREFFRDRATMAWNFMFPFVAVGAIAVIFSGDGRDLYKVGVVGLPPMDTAAVADTRAAMLAAVNGDTAVRAFLGTRYIQFLPITGDHLHQAEDRVRHHLYDLVLDVRGLPRYWVNPTNPKGYFLERVLWSAGTRGEFQRQVLEGRQIRYIDWLLPGVLAMNLMFSCLWGVGYVIVRYRKGSILRRLKVSPIIAVQFICAQIASRLVLVMFTTSVLYLGLDLVLDFFLAGRLLDLFLVFSLGAVCNIALGILIASRTSNQELAGGLLNLATWPMMFLSGVWFSMEGSAPWLIHFSRIFPLTHLIDASRKIMVDGASLAGVLPELGWLTAMTFAFLFAGAVLFRWE